MKVDPPAPPGTAPKSRSSWTPSHPDSSTERLNEPEVDEVARLLSGLVAKAERLPM